MEFVGNYAIAHEHAQRLANAAKDSKVEVDPEILSNCSPDKVAMYSANRIEMTSEDMEDVYCNLAALLECAADDFATIDQLEAKKFALSQ